MKILAGKTAKNRLLYIQPWPFAFRWLLNKPYVNEVTLPWHNPPLIDFYPLERFTQFKKGLDLSMLKIWGL